MKLTVFASNQPIFTPKEQEILASGKAMILSTAEFPSIPDYRKFEDSTILLGVIQSFFSLNGNEKLMTTKPTTTVALIKMPSWFSEYLDKLPNNQAEELIQYLESDPEELSYDLAEAIMRCSTTVRPELEKD